VRARRDFSDTVKMHSKTPILRESRRKYDNFVKKGLQNE
jgi:hypothetical protein